LINFPSQDRAREYEEGFLLTCSPARIAKIMALYESYALIRNVPGVVIDCGIFRGASFCTIASLRSLLENIWLRPLIAFDTFDSYAETTANESEDRLLKEVGSTIGIDCITEEQLKTALRSKGGSLHENVSIVGGNILETVPKFATDFPGLRVAMLCIDVDFDEPAQVIIEHLYPLVVKGGVVLYDDYGAFTGTTDTVRKFLSEMRNGISQFSFAKHPCYFVKE
jgi:hypothetical protein